MHFGFFELDKPSSPDKFLHLVPSFIPITGYDDGSSLSGDRGLKTTEDPFRGTIAEPLRGTSAIDFFDTNTVGLLTRGGIKPPADADADDGFLFLCFLFPSTKMKRKTAD